MPRHQGLEVRPLGSRAALQDQGNPAAEESSAVVAPQSQQGIVAPLKSRLGAGRARDVGCRQDRYLARRLRTVPLEGEGAFGDLLR